jgi:hypothetical protein
MSDWTEHLKQVWADRFDEHRAVKENRKPQRIQSSPGYQRLDLNNEESRFGIPQSVLDAYDFYSSNVEVEYYRSVAPFKETIQNREVFVIEVGTNGSDGWLELFDQGGQSIGAARISQERIAWREVDIIRAYLHDRGLPAELLGRRTINECFNDIQEAEVSEYFEKWKNLCFSTDQIDQNKVAEAIKAAYEVSGFTVEPVISFFDSPYAAFHPMISGIITEIKDSPSNDFNQQFKLMMDNRLPSQYSKQIFKNLIEDLEMQVNAQVDDQRRKVIFMALQDSLWSRQIDLSMAILESHLAGEVWKEFKETGVSWVSIFAPIREKIRRATIRREALCLRAASLNVYISVLGCTYDSTRWSVLEALASSCGWFTPYQEYCVVSSCPIKFLFDHDGKLHAQDESALAFIDGFSVYATHGDLDRVVNSTS